MGKSDFEILNLFKNNPSKELSTTEIVKFVFSDEYKKVEDMFENPLSDNDKINKAKRLKAQLHRKTLYYLNKLVDEGVLKMSKEGIKGQKFFQLAINEGEEFHIGKYKKKIIITRPAIPGMPIEGYEQRGIIFKYEPATWIDRLNSMLLECNAFNNLHSLFDAVSVCFTNVNDVVGLNDFESVLQNSSIDEIVSFFRKLESECIDYGKIVTCIFNLNNLRPSRSLEVIEAFNYFEKIRPDHINFVFMTNSKILQENAKFLSQLVAAFARSKIQMYVQNVELHKAPYLIGRAGPYTFDDSEWNLYESEYKDHSRGVACSQSTIAIDVDKFFQDIGMNQFRSFMGTVAKTLLFANSLQRKRGEEYFKNIIELNKNFEKEFFYLSRNYIRFWNYGWKQATIDQDLVVDLIKSCTYEMNSFCRSQESIYLACGMPVRFRISFSCAFKDFNERDFSSEKFTKIQIKRLEDMYNSDFKDAISSKEKIFEVFDGGDRLRIFRSGAIELDQVIREFGVLLNSYNIPLFCYDFGEIKGANLKLTSFIE